MMLSVNQLSRKIALRKYKLRTFDTINGSERFIYFNQDVDIIYFGGDVGDGRQFEATCISTMMHLFNSLGNPIPPAIGPCLEIPRIAVLCSGVIEKCRPRGGRHCDWDDPSGTVGVVHGVDVMQALHGIHASRTNNVATWTGCPGLKEVYWVVPSHLWEVTSGGIDPGTTGFRPISTDGLTNGQKRLKSRIENEVHRIDNKFGLTYIPSTQILWVGNNKPTFSFVSLAPHRKQRLCATEGVLYEGLEVDALAHNYFLKHGGGKKFIERTAERTGCQIRVAQHHYPQEAREIGFAGPEEAIENGKQRILAKASERRRIEEQRYAAEQVQ